VDLINEFAFGKTIAVESIALVSLVLSGVALVLIEVWGILKIWQLIRKRSA